MYSEQFEKMHYRDSDTLVGAGRQSFLFGHLCQGEMLHSTSGRFCHCSITPLSYWKQLMEDRPAPNQGKHWQFRVRVRVGVSISVSVSIRFAICCAYGGRD